MTYPIRMHPAMVRQLQQRAAHLSQLRAAPRVGQVRPWNGIPTSAPPPSSQGNVFRITYALDLFNGPKERELSRKVLGVMLTNLFEIDKLYLEAHPETPLLYRSGVRYMEEPPGQEDWQDIPTSLRMGIADCEDLATWRAAELNVRFGIKAVPIFREQKLADGRCLYHVLVQYPDGRLEDPSRILGMR